MNWTLLWAKIRNLERAGSGGGTETIEINGTFTLLGGVVVDASAEGEKIKAAVTSGIAPNLRLTGDVLLGECLCYPVNKTIMEMGDAFAFGATYTAVFQNADTEEMGALTFVLLAQYMDGVIEVFTTNLTATAT